ncbi:MAG: hypothetical protein IJP11_03630 [Oscillospiraceae bacterium]|nr:hypothetical protein [Oscillospiraceae bacterium]
MTTSLSLGMEMSIFLRLLARAPRIRISSRMVVFSVFSGFTPDWGREYYTTGKAFSQPKVREYFSDPGGQRERTGRAVAPCERFLKEAAGNGTNLFKVSNRGKGGNKTRENS